MKVFDLHCDTVSHVAWGLASSLSGAGAPKHISVEKLKKGESYVQCLGLYGGKQSSNDFEWNYMRYLFELGTRLVLQEPELHLINSMEECRDDIVNVIFTVEDSGCMRGEEKILSGPTTMVPGCLGSRITRKTHMDIRIRKIL